MLEALFTPPVILGTLLFVVIFWVVHRWILQDSDDRRDRPDRRQPEQRPVFPFYDSDGFWVTAERRQHEDRRHPHTFIINQAGRLQK